MQINRRISVDTCVRFPGEQEKLLRKVADAVSKNQVSELLTTSQKNIFVINERVLKTEVHPHMRNILITAIYYIVIEIVIDF